MTFACINFITCSQSCFFLDLEIKEFVQSLRMTPRTTRIQPCRESKKQLGSKDIVCRIQTLLRMPLTEFSYHCMQLTGTNVLKTFVNTKETILEDCGYNAHRVGSGAIAVAWA